jgi:uncharacterized membrane protein YkvA (DUF1232 family)
VAVAYASKDLVEIELNPVEARLYDRVRAALVNGAGAQAGARSGVGDLALLVPDLCVLLFRLLRDERVAVGDKAVAVAGLAYVLSPIDLVPALLFGPLGVVDDLVVVTAAASRLVNHVHPDIVRMHWSGKGDVLDAVHRVSEWSERQLGKRMRAIVRRVLPGV